MAEPEKSGKGKQEAQAANTTVTQPPTAPPQNPPTSTNAGGAGNNPQTSQPILVQLVGGDDLEPFEQQTLEIAREALAISRRTYWIAIFGFGAALAAACFVGVQVAEMTDQTEILASQSEGANAGALMDEINTRKQLAVAQKQAKAAEESVQVLNKQLIVSERPWFGVMDIKNEATNVGAETGIGAPPFKYWLILANTGKSPALAATHELTTGIFKTFPRNPPYPKLSYKLDTQVVMPGIVSPTARPAFKGTEEADILSFRKTFYVYAILHYSDPLTNRRHITKFCVFWMPVGMGFKERFAGYFAICPFYNDAD